MSQDFFHDAERSPGAQPGAYDGINDHRPGWVPLPPSMRPLVRCAVCYGYEVVGEVIREGRNSDVVHVTPFHGRIKICKFFIEVTLKGDPQL